jgi:hypothetical protein
VSVICITCTKHYLQSFIQEMNDWKDEGAQVFLSGVTRKASHGYLFVEWDKAVPEPFVKKLHSDVDVIDFFVLGSMPAAA